VNPWFRRNGLASDTMMMFRDTQYTVAAIAGTKGKAQAWLPHSTKHVLAITILL